MTQTVFSEKKRKNYIMTATHISRIKKCPQYRNCILLRFAIRISKKNDVEDDAGSDVKQSIIPGADG